MTHSSQSRQLFPGILKHSNFRYSQFSWLAYSVDFEQDKAFCYPCRIFSPNSNEPAFTRTGFDNWHLAIGKTKGAFQRHESSSSHLESSALLNDRILRDSTTSKISDLMIKKDPEHLIWLEHVFAVICYLVADGAPLRGDIECTNFKESEIGALDS